MENKSVEYYLGLPYRTVIYPSSEGGYAVEIPDLPGCVSQGETLQEALAMVEDAKLCWIADALEKGEEVPEPLDESYSGRILVRTPKSLHRALAEKALMPPGACWGGAVRKLGDAPGLFAYPGYDARQAGQKRSGSEENRSLRTPSGRLFGLQDNVIHISHQDHDQQVNQAAAKSRQ